MKTSQIWSLESISINPQGQKLKADLLKLPVMTNDGEEVPATSVASNGVLLHTFSFLFYHSSKLFHLHCKIS